MLRSWLLRRVSRAVGCEGRDGGARSRVRFAFVGAVEGGALWVLSVATGVFVGMLEIVVVSIAVEGAIAVDVVRRQ